MEGQTVFKMPDCFTSKRQNLKKQSHIQSYIVANSHQMPVCFAITRRHFTQQAIFTARLLQSMPLLKFNASPKVTTPTLPHQLNFT